MAISRVRLAAPARALRGFDLDVLRDARQVAADVHRGEDPVSSPGEGFDDRDTRRPISPGPAATPIEPDDARSFEPYPLDFDRRVLLAKPNQGLALGRSAWLLDDLDGHPLSGLDVRHGIELRLVFYGSDAFASVQYAFPAAQRQSEPIMLPCLVL